MDTVIVGSFDVSYVKCGLVPNWLGHLDRLGLRDRVVLYPLDRDAGDYARSSGCEVVELWPDRRASDDAMKLFGKDGFAEVTMCKLEAVHHALSTGRTVLHSDPDIVFLRDPLPRLATEGAEIVIQSDARPGVGLSAPRWPWSRFTTRSRLRSTICAGFMQARPTAATLRVFDRARPDAVDVRNDQDLLHDRIVWRREADYTVLPQHEFPNGAFHAHERWFHGAKALDDAYILHVNWCEGARKIELMRELGLWMPDREGSIPQRERRERGS